MGDDAGNTNALRAVQRTMHLLEAVAHAAGPMSLGDLGRACGFGKATARRFALTLVSLGYLERDARGRYCLTGRLLSIAQGAQAGALPASVWELLEQLAQATAAAVSLSVLAGAEVVYLARVPRGRVFGVELRRGVRLPAHATAIGKVLLAQLPADRLERIYPERTLPRFTDRTIGERGLLRGALQEIRRQGWALSDGELEPMLRAAAVPVFARDGRFLCALNASASAAQLSLQSCATRIVPALIRAAAQVGASLDPLSLEKDRALRQDGEGPGPRA